MKISTAVLAACAVLAPIAAHADPTSDAILRRLDKLEKENAALRHEVQAIRAERQGRAPRRAAVVERRERAPVVAVAEPVEEQPFSWAGAHVGGFAGMSIFEPNYDFSGGNDFGAQREFYGEGLSATPGVLFGMAAGYDWQRGAFVYGIGGDFAGVASRNNVGFESVSNQSPRQYIYSRTTAIGTLRARVGVAVDRALIYGTVGLAEVRISQSENEEVGGLSGSSWAPALAMGGGVEYALTDHWTIGGEGLYLAAGSAKVSGVDGTLFPTTVTESVTASQILAKASVNYKF